MTQTATGNLALVQGLYEAFGRGDVPTVLAAMDDRVEWYETEGNPWYTGRPFIGPQQVVEGVFSRIGEFEDFQIVPSRFLCDGDTVVMEGRYRATSHQATGKPLDAEVVHVLDLRDGKLARFHQYVDTRKWTDAMGIPSS